MLGGTWALSTCLPSSGHLADPREGRGRIEGEETVVGFMFWGLPDLKDPKRRLI